MPRYFFIRTDGHVEEDVEGTELPDLASARLQAVIYAGASLKDDPNFVQEGQDLRIEVSDGEGTPLFTVVTHVFDYVQRK